MIRIKFEPRDLWIGIYWNVEYGQFWKGATFSLRLLKIYICLLPLFPIVLTTRIGPFGKSGPSPISKIRAIKLKITERREPDPRVQSDKEI